VDENGCKQKQEFFIVNPSKISSSFVSKTNVTCNDLADGTILLNISGGTVASQQYKVGAIESATIATTKISNTEYKIISLSGTKTYTPVITDDNGCTFNYASGIEIVNPPRLVIKEVVASKKLCYNSTNDSTVIVIDEALYGTKGGYKYTIDNWATQQLSAVFNNVRKRTILPAVKDSNNCLATYKELPVDMARFICS
jgi:hypothetical protein